MRKVEFAVLVLALAGLLARQQEFGEICIQRRCEEKCYRSHRCGTRLEA
ncbi:MAG: hypothetical protein ACLTLQ_02665 [[Clostridium] scindens]